MMKYYRLFDLLARRDMEKDGSSFCDLRADACEAVERGNGKN